MCAAQLPVPDLPGNCPARARAQAGRAPAPARHRRALELLCRSGGVRPRDPGGRARARRPAPVRRADRPGHRHRHLSPALPRARVAPRGGALVLRGHGGADRPLRRPVPHGPRRDPRGLPRPELQHERDGGGDLRPPPHRGLSAGAREGAHGPRPDALRGPRAPGPRGSRPTGSSRRGCRSSQRAPTLTRRCRKAPRRGAAAGRLRRTPAPSVRTARRPACRATRRRRAGRAAGG